jgi:general stress protein 26
MTVWDLLDSQTEDNIVHMLYVNEAGYPQIAPMFCSKCRDLGRFITNCRPESEKLKALRKNPKSTWYFGPINKFARLYVEGTVKILEYKENE